MDLETAAETRWPLSVVRGQTPMSGEWRWTDRILAAAYRHYKANICDGCGGWIPHTTDKSIHASVSPTCKVEITGVTKCYHCDGLAAEVDKEEQYKNDPRPRFMRFLTRLVNPSDRSGQ